MSKYYKPYNLVSRTRGDHANYNEYNGGLELTNEKKSQMTNTKKHDRKTGNEYIRIKEDYKPSAIAIHMLQSMRWIL